MLSFFFEIVAQVSNLAGAIGGIVAAVGVIQLRAAASRGAQKVSVSLRLQGADRSVQLPLHLRRRDVTRAELLGRLGMLPMRQKGARFSLRALSEEDFLEQVNDVADGKSAQIVLPVSEEEISQFDI